MISLKAKSAGKAQQVFYRNSFSPHAPLGLPSWFSSFLSKGLFVNWLLHDSLLQTAPISYVLFLKGRMNSNTSSLATCFPRLATYS